MKDIMGAALLGELVAALAKSTALRRALGTVGPENADEVIRTLVNEVERLAAERAVRMPPPPDTTIAKPVPEVQPKPETRAEAPVRRPFPVPEQSRITVPEPLVQVATSVPVVPPTRPTTAEARPPALQSPVRPEPVVKPQVPQSTPLSDVPFATHMRPATVSVPPPQPVAQRAPDVAAQPGLQSVSPLHSPAARIPMPFDTERAFVLAASLIPLQDTPSRDPFKLGSEGVDKGSELFAIDHAGIRFFLSTLKSPEAGVSKAGMLLLGKQESIKHRGVHERLVNNLRLQSLILPAEAGTVVLGREDLLRRVDIRLSALLEILLGLSSLATWRVSAFVLDAEVQKMLPAEAAPVRSSRHEGERGRVVSSSKKTDIRTLERLLTREKKLAETILQKIASTADGHRVESMVSLGSGSSEDWKPILKASFDVPTGRWGLFARAVVECQDANAMFDPMLVVAGGPGSFSLSM